MKPKYMRCSVYSEANLKHISFPAMLQQKMDGTYRQFQVYEGKVVSVTRSGKLWTHSVIAEELSKYPDGIYMGEVTMQDIPDRQVANGIINSHSPEPSKEIFTMWDYMTIREYVMNYQVIYKKRFDTLHRIYGKNKGKHLNIVPSILVQNIDDVRNQVTEWLNEGYEGGVLKDLYNTFKDGTANDCLKIKLKIDADMRITGFTKGTGKRAKFFGAIEYQNDDGSIQGQCSGFTDTQMQEFFKNQEEYIGKIITVQFNDLMKAKNHSYYSLVHPRFIEIRDDKTTADTLDRVLALKEMARNAL